MKSEQIIRALRSFIYKGCSGVRYRRMRRLGIAYAMGWRGDDLGNFSRKRAYRHEHERAQRDRKRIEAMTDLTEGQSEELARQARAALMMISRSWRRR